MVKNLRGIILGLGILLSGGAYSDTLSTVKKKAHLRCGVSQGLPGFSSPDKKGRWRGIDVDVCRAVAAAVLGDASKVKYVPLSAKERFTALQSGEIDLLSRNTTWTLKRDSSLGVVFTGVTYYDGQGFMVRKDLGVKAAADLDGASVCTNLGTTTELNVADYFRSKNMKYKLVTFEKTDETLKAYDAGRCDVYTTDQSGLYALRLLLKDPKKHMILPDIISKEPLGPVVRHGDNKWGDIVRWTLYVLLSGEEYGLSSKTVDKKLASKNPAISRILGVQTNMGESLGLKKDWAFQVLKQVGHYGEMFDRNLGKDSPLKIERGINRLWNEGGLHYPMPVR